VYNVRLVVKNPLFRKVNTTAHGVHHRFGGEFRDERKSRTARAFEGTRTSMRGTVKRGLDYTPLFRFLLSKVGEEWNGVFSEAAQRIDRKEPIFWLVALRADDEQDFVRVGEASYFSGLRGDAEGYLGIVNESLGPSSLAPQCGCCTHTFNGVRFTHVFDPARREQVSAYRVA
jgi:hypothetical protein